jgi:hypothetical protein
MAIRGHNRTIWVLAVIIFVLVIVFLFRDGQFDKYFVDPAVVEADSGAAPDEGQFGDKVGEGGSAQTPKSDAGKRYALSMDRLAACFQMQGSALPENPPLQIESLHLKFQSELGPVAHQSDRWMEWHLRTTDGRERRLRLEINESDDGKIVRELHYFSEAKDGASNPLELDPSKAINPTDDVINQLLKEGEVFYKERAAVSFFPNGERVEYLEKNGDLSEVEFFKENKQFRCPDILVPETCQCI